MGQVFYWNFVPTSLEMQLFMATKYCLLNIYQALYKDLKEQLNLHGLNRYRLSFTTRFIMIGLIVSCGKGSGHNIAKINICYISKTVLHMN